MIAGGPSQTAIGVAKRRATHQLFDKPVVFDDPLAVRMVEGLGGHSAGWRGLRAFVAARSRFAEDELAVFFARQVRSYVVLGAGLDTFAYRNPYGPALKVFEVDHPATQVWKRERLKEAGIMVPESVKFIPVDFESEELGAVLKREPELDGTRPVFFSMLGVTPYLSNEGLEASFRTIAGMAAGSGVVFDYAVPAKQLNLLDRMRLAAVSARVERAGEAFRLFLEPRELAERMRGLGFGEMEDSGAREMNARYFRERTDGLKITGELGHVLRARVTPGIGQVAPTGGIENR